MLRERLGGFYSTSFYVGADGLEVHGVCDNLWVLWNAQLYRIHRLQKPDSLRVLHQLFKKFQASPHHPGLWERSPLLRCFLWRVLGGNYLVDELFLWLLPQTRSRFFHPIGRLRAQRWSSYSSFSWRTQRWSGRSWWRCGRLLLRTAGSRSWSEIKILSKYLYSTLHADND